MRGVFCLIEDGEGEGGGGEGDGGGGEGDGGGGLGDGGGGLGEGDGGEGDSRMQCPQYAAQMSCMKSVPHWYIGSVRASCCDIIAQSVSETW